MVNRRVGFSLAYVLLAIAVLYGVQLIAFKQEFQDVPYSNFRNLIEDGKIRGVLITKDFLQGFENGLPEGKPPKSEGKKYITVRAEDPRLPEFLDSHKVEYAAQYQNDWLSSVASWVLPLVILFAVWGYLFRKMGPGASMLALGKKTKILADKDAIHIGFKDVAGVDEAKEELKEIVEFLKTPKRFQELGGRMPKGVLLVGSPGTGKTLLARAVAGEAGVPFFKISGSEFVELFVGMGAARVRDLFAQAQEKAPCIIFIDELDAIGKARGVGYFGGHDEREQTLNQLLVEMDGFDSRTGIIMLAATNRPEVLDSALLRAGRFDRQVLVDRPDIRGREAILAIHTKQVKMGPDVKLERLAQMTPGLVGADLANIVNEAALLAARNRRPEVTMADFEAAIERVLAGLEKKTRVMNPQEKRTVAYHETGHALVASANPDAEPVRKVSIIPRGIGALGYTLQVPTEDRYLLTRRELMTKIDVLLGGRVAEQIIFGEISTGAQNDLQRATDMARAMVLEYGMGKTLGPVTFGHQRHPTVWQTPMPFEAQREYSEATAQLVDREIKEMLTQRMALVGKYLEQNKALLEEIAQILLKEEVLDGDRFAKIVKTRLTIPPAMLSEIPSGDDGGTSGSTERVVAPAGPERT